MKVRQLLAVSASLVSFLVVFAPLYPTLGATGGAGGIFPVLLAAWFFGLRGGVVTWLLTVSLTSAVRLWVLPEVGIVTLESAVGISFLGVVGLAAGHVRDTALQLAEREREASSAHQQLKGLIDAIPDALVRIDREGVVIDAYRAELLEGAGSKAPSKGCVMSECASPLVLSTLLPLLEQARTFGTATGLIDFNHHGAVRFLEVRLSRAGSNGELLLLFRDVTEATALQHRVLAAERAKVLAEAQARVEQSQRLASLGTLAAGIAHEINNPLTFVIANLELAELELSRPDLNLAEARQVLKDAREGASRIIDIVRDMKSLSRKSSAESVGPVDLHRAVKAAANLAAAEVRRRAVLNLELHDVPQVTGVEGPLGQIFVNLIVNAAQAMPDRPMEQNRIVVRLRKDGDQHVRAEVEDNGTGMSPEVMARIFDPFFTTKPEGIGTGLGLSISRALVERMGGTLSVSSEAGRGTTFSVRLHDAKWRPLVSASPVVIDDRPGAAAS